MEKDRIVVAVIFVSILLLAIAFFFWLVLLTQRMRANKLIQEHQVMKRDFELRQLESQIQVQEAAFAQISQEIHDNVGQVLTLSRIQLSIFEQNNLFDKEMLASIREQISAALIDLRDIAKGLDGHFIKETIFEEMIRREIARLERLGFFEIEFSSIGSPFLISGHVKLGIFRIMQEAFQNILKHSCARIVRVNFIYKDRDLYIEMIDDGKGFDLLHLQPGSGIFNMQRRAQQIGASYRIASKPGDGTSIYITIPHE